MTPSRAGRCAAIAVAVSMAAASPGLAAEPMPVEVTSRPLSSFHLLSDETRFGALEYVGGFSMQGDSRVFGQLSAMRFLTPGGSFLGVADHGYWFAGRIERDGTGVPTGVADFTMTAMVDAEGRVLTDKERVDAEGLDIGGGVATVSFERRHRISEYALEPPAMGPPLRDLDFIVPRGELRFNAAFETVLRAHPHGIHEGARIAITERSIDTDGNIFAAILEGPERGIFKVARSDDFDVTDGALLPDGDLLLLERRFRATQGVAMRLRRIYGESVRRGALADGPVLLEAGMAHQVDNMEALDVWRREDGATIVSIMSDDNQSFLQRNLYLEFMLVED